MNAVVVESLTKRFNRLTALDNVSFSVPQGSLFGLLGPNGAGKTTLFSIAAGFLKATSGTILVSETDVRKISELRGRFSMLVQDAAFQPGIPVLEQLIMFGKLNGQSRDEARQRAQEALELVGLGQIGRKSARTLSHGMHKRVELCQTFLGDPEVVFLDEPTSGLDPENARNMRVLIRNMRGKKTVLLSSHNLAEVQELCDHVAILHRGKLVEYGSMEKLTHSSFLLRIKLSQPLGNVVQSDLQSLSVIDNIELTNPSEFNLRLKLISPDEKDAAIKKILEVLASHQLYPRSLYEGASLEARFLEITGGKYDGSSST